MKKPEKYFLLILFFLICQFHKTYSQETSFFGIYISPQKTFLHGDSDFISEPTYKLSGGLLYGFPVFSSPKLILYGGFHRQGQDFHKLHNDGFAETQLFVNLDYLKTGLIVEYDIIPLKKSYLLLFGGAEINFLMSAKDNFEDNYLDNINLPKTNFSKTDFDLVFGVGYTQIINKNFSASFKVRTEQGYINVFKEKNDSVIPTQNEHTGFNKARNSTVGFMIELKYHINKKTAD